MPGVLKVSSTPHANVMAGAPFAPSMPAASARVAGANIAAGTAAAASFLFAVSRLR